MKSLSSLIIKTTHPDQTDDAPSIRVIQTSSETSSPLSDTAGHDAASRAIIQKLTMQLMEQTELAKEALASTQHYKRINENLLSAMSEMSTQQQHTFESLLQKELNSERQSHKREAQELKRTYESKLGFFSRKMETMARIQSELEQELIASKEKTVKQNQLYLATLKQLQEVRFEISEGRFVETLKKQYDGMNREELQKAWDRDREVWRSKMEKLQELVDQLRTEKEEEKSRRDAEWQNLIDSERRLFESTFESFAFDKKMLSQELESQKEKIEELNQLMEIDKENWSNLLREEQDKNQRMSNEIVQLQNSYEKLLVEKQQEVRRNQKEVIALKITLERTLKELEEVKAQNSQFEKLLDEAKFHIVSSDLEWQKLEKKNTEQKRKMAEEISRLRREVQHVRNSQEKDRQIIVQHILNTSQVKSGRSSRAEFKSNQQTTPQLTNSINNSKELVNTNPVERSRKTSGMVYSTTIELSKLKKQQTQGKNNILSYTVKTTRCNDSQLSSSKKENQHPNLMTAEKINSSHLKVSKATTIDYESSKAKSRERSSSKDPNSRHYPYVSAYNSTKEPHTDTKKSLDEKYTNRGSRVFR